jgi:hypothetical protein
MTSNRQSGLGAATSGWGSQRSATGPQHLDQIQGIDQLRVLLRGNLGGPVALDDQYMRAGPVP